MIRTLRTWFLPAVLLCALPAPGQVVIQDGTPGLYGTPYAYLGWRDAKLWENYVKADIMPALTEPAPSLLAGSLSNPVTYQDVRAGYTDASNYSFSAPGVFVGTVRSTQSYPETALSLFSPQGGVTPRYLDVRVGFGEHLAAGGGASFGTMIANNGGGGAGSPMDLYQGNWGVDGLEMHVILESSGANWVLSARNCYLVAPTSPNEIGRTDHVADSAVQGGTQLSATSWDTGIPSGSPLGIQWRLDTSAGPTQLILSLGGAVDVHWAFDGGGSRFGLTDPGNPAGEPYQNGSLDPASFVPLLYVGVGEETTFNQSVAAVQVPLVQTVAGPALAGLSASVGLDTDAPFTVSWIDDLGQIDTANTGTVHFQSSDASDLVPPDYTFTAADSGTHAFQARFGTAGSHSLTASRVSLPLLRSSVTTQVATGVPVTPVDPVHPVSPTGRERRGPFDVGFNCSTTGATQEGGWLALLLLAGAPHGLRHSRKERRC